MTFWLAKIFQASGLAVMAWGFVSSYPKLMSHHIFLLSAIFFVIGWLIQSFMLKN